MKEFIRKLTSKLQIEKLSQVVTVLLYGPPSTSVALEIYTGGVMVCGKQTSASFFFLNINTVYLYCIGQLYCNYCKGGLL